MSQKLQFGMTGDLHFNRRDEKEPRHANVLFCFLNDSPLAYIEVPHVDDCGVYKLVSESPEMRKPQRRWIAVHVGRMHA